MLAKDTQWSLPSRFRPPFMDKFVLENRDVDSLPQLNDENEMKEFVRGVKAWMRELAPPSCVADYSDDFEDVYTPLMRVSGHDVPLNDKRAWSELSNGGINGIMTLIMCFFVWKKRSSEMFGTEEDYELMLGDVNWIMDKAVRLGREKCTQ